MNEFVSHVLGSLERHETSIAKLSKANKKLSVLLIIIGGFAFYQSMRIDDLKFEMDKKLASHGEDSKESNIN